MTWTAPWQLEWSTSGADLAAYRQLLGEQATLSERDDILPFFRRHADLAALLGTYHPNIERYDRLGVEVPLFGEYVADVVVGDRANNALCFVELEDGRPRLAWRSKRVQIAGQRVVCATFDDVARRLQQRLQAWPDTPMVQSPPQR